MNDDRTARLNRFLAIVFRAVLALACIELVDTALFYEDSMPYRMVLYGGEPARVLTIAQAFVAFVALLEVLACDLLPEARWLRWLRGLAHWRVHIWLAMGVGYAMQAFAALHYDFWPRLGLLYLLQGFTSALIAWAEMQLRFEHKCEVQRQTGFADLRDG